MPKSSQSAALAISLNVAGLEAATERSLPVAVNTLARFFAQHRVAATWGFDLPGSSPLLTAVQAIQPSQEIAIVARGAWGAADASRALFDAELSRRVAAAEETGARASTLLVAGGATPAHLDLVEKHGVTALCRIALNDSHSAIAPASLWRSGWFAPSAARAGAAPRSLRWGLWQMPAAIDLARLGSWRTRQSILRRAASEGFAHLCIDMTALCTGGARAERQLDAVLTLAAAWQNQGNLRLQGVAETVAQLSVSRQGPGAQSILRKAA